MQKYRPSREYLASLFAYEPDTGNLIRIQSRPGVTVGDIAGCVDDQGYVKVYIDRRAYLVHRIVWILVHGEWPSGEIDHINGNKADNRIANLRVCSRHENQRNTKMRKDNSSGVKGVVWDKRINAWFAQVALNGKTFYGGSFKDLEDAKRAAIELRNRLHGEFANHGEKPA